MKQKNFYVYIYLDPRKKGKYRYENYLFEYEPFYVGKGKDDRMNIHLYEKKSNNKSKFNKIQKIKKEGFSPVIKKLYVDLEENESFKKEKELINIIGRKDLKLGPLCNLTDGGEGSSGYIFSLELRKYISEHVSGKNNGMYGKKHSEKSILKIKDKRKLQIFTEETKKLWRKQRKGKNNSFYGKHHSEETKRKLRKKLLGDKSPRATKYIIENSQGEILILITKKSVNDYLGNHGYNYLIKNKFYQGYRLIDIINNKKNY